MACQSPLEGTPPKSRGLLCDPGHEARGPDSASDSSCVQVSVCDQQRRAGGDFADETEREGWSRGPFLSEGGDGVVSGGRKGATETKRVCDEKEKTNLPCAAASPSPLQRPRTNYSIKFDIREANFIRASRRMKR